MQKCWIFPEFVIEISIVLQIQTSVRRENAVSPP